MEIIDAFWEKNNLGVSCIECHLNEKDRSEDISKKINNLPCDYAILKIPNTQFESIRIAQNMGYNFVETIFNITHDLKPLSLNNIQLRYSESVTYHEMNLSDLDELYKELRKDIFKTDRIAIDPRFSKEMASNRYVNWIQTELSQNSKSYVARYKDKNIGFFTMKDTGNKIMFPFLTGLYKEFEKSPLGFTIILKILEEAKKQGGKKISSYVSSNNLTVLKVNIDLGFKISGIKYTFVKHN